MFLRDEQLCICQRQLLIMEFGEVNGTQLIDWVCYFDQSSVKHFGITTTNGPSATITIPKVPSVLFKVALGSLN